MNWNAPLFDLVSRLAAGALFYTWGLVKLILHPPRSVQRDLFVPVWWVALMYALLAVGDIFRVVPTGNLNQLVRVSILSLACCHIWAEFSIRQRTRAFDELARLATYYRLNPHQPVDSTALLTLFGKLGYGRGENVAGVGRAAGSGKPMGVEKVRGFGEGLPRGGGEESGVDR